MPQLSPPEHLLPSEGYQGWSYRSESSSDGTRTTTIIHWKITKLDGSVLEVTETTEVDSSQAKEKKRVEGDVPALTVCGLRAAFEKADANGDGTVSYLELKKLLISQGVKKGDAERHVTDFSKASDLTRTGTVDYEHFLHEYTRLRMYKMCKDAPKLFKKMDANGDGKVDRNEFLTVMKELLGEDTASSECDDIFVAIDSDGNGWISQQELLDWYKRKAKTTAKMYKKKEQEVKGQAPPILDLKEACLQAAGAGPINIKICEWLHARYGTQIGNGQCWVTACNAMLACGATKPWGYDWFGDEVKDLSAAKPGDIMTFDECKLEWKTGWMTAGMPKHTAVVWKVDPKGTLVGTGKLEMILLESNSNQVMSVLHSFYRLGCLTKGTVKCWRPVAAEDGPKRAAYIAAQKKRLVILIH